MAGGRIKGITIEIGGDTTKLDKALEGTNKQLKTTQGNLKDVERLLKLDPGNTELLAQKERYLAEQMEQTAEKAKKLKEAVESADGAVTRKQEFDKKYAPLVKSLAEANSSYEKLKDRDAEMKRQVETGEISTAQYEKYSAELEEARKNVRDLSKEVAAAKKEMGGPMMDQAQFDALNREMIAATEAAKDAKKAYYQFDETLAGISDTADKVADGASKVADATKGISTAAGVAAGGLIAMAVEAGKSADDLNTLSKQTGFSTKTLQEWQYASDLIDVSVDDIVSAARRMKMNMTSESEDVKAAWEKLGVSVVDNSGQMRDAEGVFYDLATGLSQIENETERDTLAMTLFGKSADSLAGILDDGGKSLRELGQEARAAGLILTQDALAKANEFNDGLDKLKATAKATFMESGADLARNLLPALESVVEAVGSLLSWFASLDGGTLQLLLSVLLAVAAIAPVASAISAIAGTISTISTGITALTGALGAFNITSAMTTMTLGKWILIIGAVVVAVWLLVAAFNALTGKTQKVEMPDLPEVPDTSSVGRGRPSQQASGGRMRAVTAADLPHLAQGTVTRPNSPFVAVVGDNPQEPEVIAPYSAIKRAARDAMTEAGAARGGAQAITINFTGDLAQLARVLHPYITSEGQRLGPNLVT